MTIIAFSLSTRRPTTGLLLSVTAILLTGCAGGSSTAQGPVVTVTVTPTVTASGAPASATAATTTTQAGTPRSDVVGRKFDLGTIVKVVQDGGVPVIIFDRWTARGVPDSRLAANGVPMAVHSDAPYENLNSRTTFRIPVVQGAIFTYTHCVAVDQPAQQRSSTLQEFGILQGFERVILLTLDPQGRVIKAQNDPAC
ncbi:MAG: hypothetical protein ACYDDU_02830 [Dermatophilaceae bacterium]